jgi:hypothetical protein
MVSKLESTFVILKLSELKTTEPSLVLTILLI